MANPVSGKSSVRDTFLAWLSLFGSAGTLVCCALPSLLVIFGLGASVATALSAAPWLVTMSRHKNWVFALSGLAIAGNMIWVYRISPGARSAACDPADTSSPCAAVSGFSRIILWLSATLFLVGCFTAYFLGPILVIWDG